MNMIVNPVIPNTPSLSTDNWLTIINVFVLISLSVLTAFCVSTYASNKWKGDKFKTTFSFVGIILIFTVLLVCFFGCTAITVRGIIFCLILLLSSYSDIHSRECSDWLHVMIVIAAFIGFDFANLPTMFVATMFTGSILLITKIITKNKLGGADIKCVAACSFLLGLEKGVIALVAGMLLAILSNAFRNKEKRRGGFPLIPYLAVGYLAVYLF